jgi:hypothetical protein
MARGRGFRLPLSHRKSDAIEEEEVLGVERNSSVPEFTCASHVIVALAHDDRNFIGVVERYSALEYYPQQWRLNLYVEKSLIRMIRISACVMA